MPRFHTLRVRGVVQGHRVGVLIDGGATHNFIDSAWVAKRGIQTEKFEGFTVAVARNSSMECNYWIPKLNVTLGKYQMTDDRFLLCSGCIGYSCCIGCLVALFYRKIHYGLQGNGNGIPGAR